MMPTPRRSAMAAILVIVAILAAAGGARANGRFPTALQLTFGPGARSPLMALETTFGLVSSSDGGRTWRYTCEEAVGFVSSLRWDMALAITAEGAVVAGLPDGLSVGGADRCAFDRPASAPPEPVVDLASDPSGRRLAAAVSALGTPPGVALSDDQGRSWRMGWSADGLTPLTVDIAPSDARRLYLSGYFGNTPVLLRSDDGGATFARTAAEFADSVGVYVTAVDPARPDTLYLRSELRPRGVALLRSDDGGRSFRELIRTGNRMTGAALAPDGQTMWVGSPGGDLQDGVFRTLDGGATWRRMAGGYTVLCLRHHDGILYMCGDGARDGFALGCSTDGGESFAAVLAWADLVGPEGCPAGSAGRTRCQTAWPPLRALLVPDGGRPPPSPGCQPGGGGAEGGAGDGAPALPDVSAPPDAAAADRPAAGPDARSGGDGGGKGCGCRVGGRAAPAGSLALLALAALSGRRPRRSRSCPTTPTRSSRCNGPRAGR